jgi:hypothetical protein
VRFRSFDDAPDLDTIALPNNIISIEVKGHYLAWLDDLTAELSEDVAIAVENLPPIMIMARSDVFRRLIRAVWPKVMPTGRELTMIMACACTAPRVKNASINVLRINEVRVFIFFQVVTSVRRVCLFSAG